MYRYSVVFNILLQTPADFKIEFVESKESAQHSPRDLLNTEKIVFTTNSNNEINISFDGYQSIETLSLIVRKE
jgi:hypothetical protein